MIAFAADFKTLCHVNTSVDKSFEWKKNSPNQTCFEFLIAQHVKREIF
jgi:hypothetical protein